MEGQALARPTATSRAPHGMLVCSSERSWTRVSIRGNALRDPPPLLGARPPPAPGRAGAGGAGGAVWEPPPSSKAPAGALTSAVPQERGAASGLRSSRWKLFWCFLCGLSPHRSPRSAGQGTDEHLCSHYGCWTLRQKPGTHSGTRWAPERWASAASPSSTWTPQERGHGGSPGVSGSSEPMSTWLRR